MSSIFAVVWRRLLGSSPKHPPQPQPAMPADAISLPDEEAASSTMFLLLRRMRASLIVLIVIYAVSVLGLTLIPGADGQGAPWRMGFFHAFYFMSYTATTIGFGEIPYAFTDAQRLWVTLCIYLTVIGWAYAVGTLLGLLQDRGFRQAMAVQRFARHVRRIREPYYLIAGYGQTGRLLGHALDARGKRFVVLDIDEQRIDETQLANYRADVPALAADGGNPAHLRLAGLLTRHCAGVFALTDNDQSNLAVATATRLLRPDLPVLARCQSQLIGEQLTAIEATFIVNPFDRFGDYLALAMRAPATFRLMEWIAGFPDSELPPRRAPPRGRWIVCGYGRFGREVVRDLEHEGIEVAIIDPGQRDAADPRIIAGVGSERDALERAGIARAQGLVAGTGNDTTNLSIVAAARRQNPDLYVVARQNRQANAPLYQAIAPEFIAVPSEVVAHECLARVTTPLFIRFLELAQSRGDAFALPLIANLEARFGRRVPVVWAVHLNHRGAPAIARWLAQPGRTLALADLLRNPAAREQVLPAVALMVVRDDAIIAAPADDFVLAAGDHILMAGRGYARRHLYATLHRELTCNYVLTGRNLPSGWMWQKFAGAEP